MLRHYIRIKIFTDRGREAQSKIDIPYLKDQEISDIAARTIKSDGTIVELKKSDIFDRTIVKASGTKLKAKSCSSFKHHSPARKLLRVRVSREDLN